MFITLWPPRKRRRKRERLWLGRVQFQLGSFLVPVEAITKHLRRKIESDEKHTSLISQSFGDSDLRKLPPPPTYYLSHDHLLQIGNIVRSDRFSSAEFTARREKKKERGVEAEFACYRGKFCSVVWWWLWPPFILFLFFVPFSLIYIYYPFL